MKRILLGAMVFVLSSVQAHAQTSCSDFTIEPNQQVAACTTLITKGPPLRITRADELPFSLYLNRGAAFARNGEIERSKADFRQAIEMTTKALGQVGKPPPREYNNRCWARAVANVELDLALLDCNEALRSVPRNSAFLDSRAFVYLRLGRNEDAIRDYDAGLKTNATRPTSLYGRGVAKLRLGDVERAKADLFLAETLGPGTRVKFAAFGIAEYPVLTSAQSSSTTMTPGAQVDGLTPANSLSAIDAYNAPPGFVPPRLDQPRPFTMSDYPADAFFDAVEGISVIRILVREDGTVGDVQVMTSSGSAILDGKAGELAKLRHYAPATVQGQPVAAWIRVNYDFKLPVPGIQITPASTYLLGFERGRPLTAKAYPPESLRNREEGTVRLRFRVGDDGKLSDPEVLQSSGHPKLDQAAIVYLMHNQFVAKQRPQTRVRDDVTFKLK